MTLTRAERIAVNQAARNMTEWRENRTTVRTRETGARYRVLRKARQPEGDPPDTPLVALRERGVIDSKRETELTAMAYEQSLANG